MFSFEVFRKSTYGGKKYVWLYFVHNLLCLLGDGDWLVPGSQTYKTYNRTLSKLKKGVNPESLVDKKLYWYCNRAGARMAIYDVSVNSK